MISSRTKFILSLCFLFSLSACAPQTKTSDPAGSKTVDGQPGATRVSAENTDAAEPSAASDADGNVYVVYVEHNPDKSADLFLQKFDPSGNPNGEKTRVNPEKGGAKSWFGDAPTIRTGKDGRIFVGWTAKTEKPGGNVLYLSVSVDGGKTFDAPVKVNDDAAPASHGMHSMSVGPDGRVFFAWLDERNVKTAKASAARPNENFLPEGFQIVKANHGPKQKENSNRVEKPKVEKKEMQHQETEPNSEVFFAVSSDGGKTFSANKKLSEEVCPCCKTSVLAAPDGRIYVSWRQVLEGKFRHIAVAASDDGGASFEKFSIVSDDKWELDACPVSGASMTFNGALKIVWYTAGDAGSPGLYYAESKDGGKTFGPRAQISGETVTGTSTILGETDGSSRIVFSEAGNRITVGSAGGAKNEFKSSASIDKAQLPAAAFAGENLFVAFVREEAGKRSVWISKISEK